MKNKSAVVLLSGGLDSVVSLADMLKRGCNVKLALTFDYGQKSFEKELSASKNIASYYKIKHKTIQLDWLKEITNTTLVSNNDIPEINISQLDDKIETTESMKSVWVPNRNGLFINIAAAYCDSYLYDCIIIGANKEEAATFSDNSEIFIKDINKALETSTNHKIQVSAPLISMNKEEIVQKALELNVPLNYINSCYKGNDKHCGKCESCNRLKRALEANKLNKLITELFS